jgi:hypothetical protein
MALMLEVIKTSSLLLNRANSTVIQVEIRICRDNPFKKKNLMTIMLYIATK